MRGHAREIAGRVGLLAALILTGGCGGWGDDLARVEHLPLRQPVEAGATLYVESSDRFLIGEAGRLRRVQPGVPPATLATGDTAIPAVVTVIDGGIIVQWGDRLLRLSQSGEMESAEGGMEESLFGMDPRGRWIIQGAASGAVFGHSPATLTPRWGWASLGQRTTGLAVSPQGGALVQAVPGEIILRDLQTGRTLATMEVAAPFRQLQAAGSGRVYGIAGTEGRGTVFAIRMGGTESHIVWRRTLDDLDLGDGAELRLSQDGSSLVVFVAGSEGGLRLLDAETGAAIGSLLDGPLDADYGASGELFMLYPQAIRTLR